MPEGIDGEAVAAAAERGDPSGAPEPWRSLLGYAVKLTRDPAACAAADVEALRAVGLTDPQISDGVQVAAYFNYINRIAEGLGVDLEPEMGSA